MLIITTPFTLTFIPEHLHLISNNFGNITLVAVTIVVRTRLNFPFNIDLFPFVQKFPANFRQLPPDNNIMPLGLFLLLSVATLKALGGCQGKGRNSISRRGIA